MANYSYKLVTEDGLLKNGSIFAYTKRGAEKKLSKGGSIVIFISNTNTSLFFWRKRIDLPWSFFSEMEKINFFRNLSMMISSGLSIIEALTVSAGEIKSNKTKKVMNTMIGEMKNGERFSKAMARFPNYFSQFIIKTVNVGEISGTLSEVLDRIAVDLEKNKEIKRKIINALLYPAIIIFAMSAVVIILMVCILPEIGKIYQSLNTPTPLPTKILLYSGDFLRFNFHILLLTLAIFIIFGFFSLKIKKIHYAFDYLMLKIPVLGDLIKEYNLVLFFRSVESLIKSGVSIVSSVNIASKTIKNDVYKKAFNTVHPILLRGVPLSHVLTRFPSLFSAQTQKIIEVGERTGNINSSFARITNYYENTFDYKVKMMTTVIEPLLMLMLGVIVGIMAISVFLPIYQLVNII